MATSSTPNIRHPELDALRGFAVMGILAMNIAAFALPLASYSNPAAGGPPTSSDLTTWFFNFIFIDSKMRSLFSMLFGASTLLMIERALPGPHSAAGAHYLRMFWLLTFGCIHFYLIWFGDILVNYAMSGCLLYLLRNISVKALWRWAIGLFAVQFLYVGAFALLLVAAATADATPQMKELLQEMNRAMGVDAAQTAIELRLYRGGYAEIVAHRTGEMLAYPFVSFFQYGLETLGLMVTGMALFRGGFMTGKWEAARYRNWARTCLAIAIPPLAAMAWWNFSSDFSVDVVFGTSFAWSMPFDVFMAIGYAAIIVMMCKVTGSAPIIERVAAAGRMAFTNYLTTSIVMTTIFYGYGLGLYGSVGRTALYLFCFGMWAAILMWSKPWLTHYHYGPLEWLWRSLSRFELQPFRRA